MNTPRGGIGGYICMKNIILFFIIAESLASSYFIVPSLALASLPNNNNLNVVEKGSTTKKNVLFIFGHGNVAQSVIQYANAPERLKIASKTTKVGHGADERASNSHWLNHTNDDRKHCVDISYFDSIICTYYNEIPSQLPQDENVTYIPFREEVILSWIKEFSGCSFNFLVTIPPQPKQSNDSDKNNNSNNDYHQDNETIIYKDVIFDSKIKNAIPSDSKLAFVSTTGVYGNHNGQWVNEDSEPKCKITTKAFSYLTIEKQWNNTFAGTAIGCCCIFRCSALYGKEFSALHTVKKNGFSNNNDESESITPLTSRVHLDDVGRAIVAYMIEDKNDGNSEVVNLSDDMPAARNNVMKFAFDLLQQQGILVSNKVSNPKQDKSERSIRRGKESKRVSNKNMKELLKPYGGLKYPSYNEGLKNILAINIGKWRNSQVSK